ncbi:hypothetical protein AAMO2058_000936600 [Amorphochlora amoebiformis]
METFPRGVGRDPAMHLAPLKIRSFWTSECTAIVPTPRATPISCGFSPEVAEALARLETIGSRAYDLDTSFAMPPPAQPQQASLSQQLKQSSDRNARAILDHVDRVIHQAEQRNHAEELRRHRELSTTAIVYPTYQARPSPPRRSDEKILTPDSNIAQSNLTENTTNTWEKRTLSKKTRAQLVDKDSLALSNTHDWSGDLIAQESCKETKDTKKDVIRGAKKQVRFTITTEHDCGTRAKSEEVRRRESMIIRLARQERLERLLRKFSERGIKVEVEEYIDVKRPKGLSSERLRALDNMRIQVRNATDAFRKEERTLRARFRQLRDMLQELITTGTAEQASHGSLRHGKKSKINPRTSAKTSQTSNRKVKARKVEIAGRSNIRFRRQLVEDLFRKVCLRRGLHRLSRLQKLNSLSIRLCDNMDTATSARLGKKLLCLWRTSCANARRLRQVAVEHCLKRAKCKGREILGQWASLAGRLRNLNERAEEFMEGRMLRWKKMVMSVMVRKLQQVLRWKEDRETALGFESHQTCSRTFRSWKSLMSIVVLKRFRNHSLVRLREIRSTIIKRLVIRTLRKNVESQRRAEHDQFLIRVFDRAEDRHRRLTWTREGLTEEENRRQVTLRMWLRVWQIEAREQRWRLQIVMYRKTAVVAIFIHMLSPEA